MEDIWLDVVKIPITENLSSSTIYQRSQEEKNQKLLPSRLLSSTSCALNLAQSTLLDSARVVKRIFDSGESRNKVISEDQQ